MKLFVILNSTLTTSHPFFFTPQIIAERPKRRGPARRGARAQVLGTTTSPTTRARATAAAPNAKPAPAAASQPSDKIIVSNLPQDVNEAQIKV